MEPKVRDCFQKSGGTVSDADWPRPELAAAAAAAVTVVLFLSLSSSWYKDGEQIVASVPGYIVLKGRDLRIVANEFNEGVYTCRIHRGGSVVSSNSWAVHLKPPQPTNS